MSFRSVTYKALKKMHRLESAPRLRVNAAPMCGNEPCIVACCDHLVVILTHVFSSLEEPGIEKRVQKFMADLATLREDVHRSIDTGIPIDKKKRLVTSILSNYTHIHRYFLKQKGYAIPITSEFSAKEWPDMIFSCVAAKVL